MVRGSIEWDLIYIDFTDKYVRDIHLDVKSKLKKLVYCTPAISLMGELVIISRVKRGFSLAFHR